MSHTDIEPYLIELRRLADELQTHQDDADPIVEAINDQLLTLASRRPNWEITIVADVVMQHHTEAASHRRRLLSAGIRLPQGVSLCLWRPATSSLGDSTVDLELADMRPSFLPLADAPPTLRRLLLPLVGYALESFCEQLRS